MNSLLALAGILLIAFTLSDPLDDHKGDYVPVGGTGKVLSAIASLSGLFVVTLAIIYILSVVSAVAAKRQLAGWIHSLGNTPADVVLQAWDGNDFSRLDQHLPALASALEHHAQRHLAYPVLHYFHATRRRAALGRPWLYSTKPCFLSEGIRRQGSMGT